MVEQQQDFSDVKGSEVDVFRDTALRYLGECFIYRRRHDKFEDAISFHHGSNNPLIIPELHAWSFAQLLLLDS